LLAQGNSDDLDALFSEEIIVPEGEEQRSSAQMQEEPSQGVTSTSINPLQGLLQTETVKIGGSISGSIESSWTWSDPWSKGFEDCKS